jgi:hypothetical protein
MAWFLIVVLTLVTVLALLAVFAMAAVLGDDDEAAERARIETEVRRAERRLHDIASQTFQSMLDEARAPGRGG